MEQRPNILLITTDQHSAEALGHLGCNDVKTPGMDRLAARGISFTKSYSANPVCCPARASWFTGTPHPRKRSRGQWCQHGSVHAGPWTMAEQKWLQRLLQRKMAYSRQRCRTEFPPYLPRSAEYGRDRRHCFDPQCNRISPELPEERTLLPVGRTLESARYLLFRTDTYDARWEDAVPRD